MPVQPNTLILRFRDLVTEGGGTINSHLAIVLEKGYVWWAWWKKPNEQVAGSVFPDLARKARTGNGLEILLLDSGRSLLYVARCTEIRFDPSYEEIKSPEAETTPLYYRERPYKVWFKFEDITRDPVDEARLRQYSYLQVDDFFESGESKFTPFYGKQVRSAEELRQQNRTVWFVRPVENNDPTHEIQLLDAYVVRPSHFPEDFIQVNSSNVLWLSDLHFSDDGHHGYPLQADVMRIPLQVRLEAALRSYQVRDIGALIVSGDLTFKATPSEFDMAKNFITGLSSLLKLKDYSTTIVPGNHDIKFSEKPEEKGGSISVAPVEAREQFAKLYNDLYYIAPNSSMSSGRRLLLRGGVTVEIASLNSQLLDQAPNIFQGQGFVGDTQLREVADGMGWSIGTSTSPDVVQPFRIVVVHHHLVPITYRDKPQANAHYSVLLDAEALSRWVVRHRVNLVLHGHMHHPFWARISRSENGLTTSNEHTFHVVAMGSTGVSLKHVGEIRANTFGVLSFEKKGFVAINIFKIDPSIDHGLQDALITSIEIPL